MNTTKQQNFERADNWPPLDGVRVGYLPATRLKHRPAHHLPASFTTLVGFKPTTLLHETIEFHSAFMPTQGGCEVEIKGLALWSGVLLSYAVVAGSSTIDELHLALMKEHIRTAVQCHVREYFATNAPEIVERAEQQDKRRSTVWNAYWFILAFCAVSLAVLIALYKTGIVTVS